MSSLSARDSDSGLHGIVGLFYKALSLGSFGAAIDDLDIVSSYQLQANIRSERELGIALSVIALVAALA